MPLRMPEFKCGNGKGDIACVHVTEVYGEVRIELVKSYPRNEMRLGNHIHAHSHISSEGKAVEWEAWWTPESVWTLTGTEKSVAAAF
jgi:hypothetical protein